MMSSEKWYLAHIMTNAGPKFTQQLALESPHSDAFNEPKAVLPYPHVGPQFCKYHFLQEILLL